VATDDDEKLQCYLHHPDVDAEHCVSLYMGVIRIGDAAEYSRLSLGDPSLETGGGKV
jgi:hypothetical protein